MYLFVSVMSSSNNVTDVAKSQEQLCAEKELLLELWPMHFPGDEFDHENNENNEKVIIIGLLTSFFTAHADVYLKRVCLCGYFSLKKITFYCSHHL